MDKKVADIRGVTITVTNGRILLPNATVAEVITFSEPEIVPHAPDWLLGRLRWRGWKVPLISFARLAGFADKEQESGAKVAVLKALSGNPKLPYFCMVTQGFPRLTTVPAAELQDAPTDAPLPPGARMRVVLRDDPAYVPDLEEIEGRLAEALAAG